MSSMLLLLCVNWFRLAAALSATPYALQDVKLHFEHFVEQHSKYYSSENEKQARFEIFKDNVESVNYMNERSDHAVFGITKFMDLTKEEFLRSYTGLLTSFDDDDFSSFDDGCELLTDSDVPDADAPATFDWRDHHAVTRVKDQSICGSCYAFSATGNIEGQYAIKHKKLIELSEQQIVDCGSMMMCYGGLPSLAFRLAAALSATPYALQDVKLHFEHFVEQHSKYYSSENEKQARFEIFKDNVESVNYMNERSDHAVFGITKFMDLTKEEFLRSYTGLLTSFDDDDFSSFDDGCELLTDSDVPDADAPATFDWRDHHAVTRVKDQSICGSCYAFSATGNIEGQYAIKHKKLIELSEQQIVDCGSMMMCYGGLPSLAFRALIDMGGAESEDNYPYTASNDYCTFNKRKVKVKLTDCYRYNLTSQDKVKQLLYKNGPISIAVTAHEFQKYVKGIMSDEFCGNNMVRHAVLLVGYGTEDGKDYWIVKNSWGKIFGEDGYIRMQRGENISSCKMLNDKMAMSIIL